MERPRSLVVLGAGGAAHIAYWHIQETWPGTELVFLDDSSEKLEETYNGRVYPLVKDWDFGAARRAFGGGKEKGFTEFFLGVTDPKLKKLLVEKALAHGLQPALPLIHPRAILHGSEIEIGRGCFILGGAVVQVATRLEEYVTVISNAVVGHHCVLRKYCTQNVGSVTLGFVELGEGVEIGTGSCVRGRIKIAPWVVTGMQSAIVKDIDEPGCVMVGVPARPLRKDETLERAPGDGDAHIAETRHVG